MKVLTENRAKYIRFADSILNSVQDAEDVVQDCYIKIIEQEQRLIANPEAYMMQAVRNKCLDYLRKNRPESLDDYERELPPMGADVLYRLEHKDTLGRLQCLLQLLSEKQRTVFYLRDVEAYTLEEIAGLTGLSNEAVRANLSRARKQLRILYTQLL